MTRRRTRRPRRQQAPPAATPAFTWEKVLRFGLYGVLGLLLLTPFVVTPGTVFPFVVGKALWTRALIEIAFALWAVLALLRPDYRPPPSWLLLLLAAGLCSSLISAWTGASPQRSLWSTYERMQGVIEQAHWLAMAVVLASLVHSARAWRALLAANLSAGTAMAFLVVLRALDIHVPFFGSIPEEHLPRLSGLFGNPTYLSIYLLVNLVLAAGFAARAWLSDPQPAPSAPRRRWTAAGWTAVAALHLAGLMLTGSVGGVAGLIAALGFAALAFAVLERGPRRAAAIVLLVVLTSACAGLAVRFLDSDRTSIAWLTAEDVDFPGGKAVRYMGRVHLDSPTVQGRLRAWQAGLDGIAERPLLGWGPENYSVVYGRFATGYGATGQPHDQPHAKLVEVAATTGASGLALWLALWGLALLVLLRAARAMARQDRAFTVFAAAALAGSLVQIQFLFDTSAGSLLATLLLALAVRLEADALPRSWGPRVPARLRLPLAARWTALLGGWQARTTLAAAAAVLAAAGLAVNHAILAAADVRNVRPRVLLSMTAPGGIGAFPPLANLYREQLFVHLDLAWPRLRPRDPARALALLDRADREAREAIRTEPSNWRTAHLLARLYRTAAATDPEHDAAAREHLARARALAPHRAVFGTELEPPVALDTRPLSGSRIELQWRPSPGAGYHKISRSHPSGSWRPIHYAYDTAQTTIVVPACPGCAYHIQACRYWLDCSAWDHWPPTGPDAGKRQP